MVGKTAGPVIRAVVVDVDGTILRSDHTISPATRHAVAEVIGLGVPVILASSRKLSSWMRPAGVIFRLRAPDLWVG